MQIYFSFSGADPVVVSYIHFSSIFCSDHLQIKLHPDTETAVKKGWESGLG